MKQVSSVLPSLRSKFKTVMIVRNLITSKFDPPHPTRDQVRLILRKLNYRWRKSDVRPERAFREELRGERELFKAFIKWATDK